MLILGDFAGSVCYQSKEELIIVKYVMCALMAMITIVYLLGNVLVGKIWGNSRNFY